MSKIEERIQQLEKQIVEKHVTEETKLLIEEMKKIGIEKLPYSYSALKKFIDAETMDFHYNKHYKGYVDKLNAALDKRKTGSEDLEEIIKNISRYNNVIRNNAGGAFNHALFWNMLSPAPQKLKGDLYNKITKEFTTFNNFKKKFETIAKERFGSGWVWLVLTPKGGLKIMSTPNQDNPLMNVIEGGGFPLLGLDLWEHAYYLKYRNKRDEYISNFWKVVNWDFVTKLFELKTKTKLIEAREFQQKLEEIKDAKFCDSKETIFFKAMIDDREIKKLYQDGVNYILKKVFPQHWVEGNDEEMSGFYGVESEEGRSILNNLNTNFNTFCLLVDAVNKQIMKIGKPEKKFDFSKDEKRKIGEVKRFLNALNHFKNDIFSQSNPDFINIVKVLLKLWSRGQKTEEDATKKIEDYFEGNAKVIVDSGHGKKRDAMKGIDRTIILNGTEYSSQIKPYSSVSVSNEKIKIYGTGNVKSYDVDWLIFNNQKTNKILIFKNEPISTTNNYIFNLSSLLHEIE